MPDKFEEELAKAAAQATVETARDARKVLGQIFGEAITELAAGLGEKVRRWRLENLFKTLTTAQRLCEEQGVPVSALKALPLGDAVRVIQAASQEEEEDVQALWAQLIANAANPSTGVTAKKHFIDILQSLSSPEAALLELLYECQAKGHFETLDDVAQYNQEMDALAEKRWRQFPEEVRDAATQNLARLRCVTFRPRPVDLSGLFRERRSGGGSQRPPLRATDDEGVTISRQAFEQLIKHLLDVSYAAAAIRPYRQSEWIPVLTGRGDSFQGIYIDFPEANFVLTALGSDLVKACAAPGEET